MDVTNKKTAQIHAAKKIFAQELTDKEIISRFSTLHALLTWLSNPTGDAYKGIP